MFMSPKLRVFLFTLQTDSQHSKRKVRVEHSNEIILFESLGFLIITLESFS